MADGEIRAAIRRLRQANIAGVLKASEHRNASECERAWSALARYADEPSRTEAERYAAAAWPACPTCGEPGVSMSIGSVTRQPAGLAPVSVESGASVGMLPVIECVNGHTYTEAGKPCGPPQDITIKEGWRP